MKNDHLAMVILFLRDSGGIQTHNLLIRSQMLYSVELRNLRSLIAGAKVRTFFVTAKLFTVFFRKKQKICIFVLYLPCYYILLQSIW